VNFDALPGGDRVAQGLRDLAADLVTPEALLVLIGAPRLRALGLTIPPRPAIEHPEHVLYERLAATNSLTAHSRYNALIRQLVSFERAAECAR
jgi:hypothetical protein